MRPRPRPLAPLSRLQDDTHLLALHAGTPAPALTETGLPPDHRYLLFVRLTDVADIDAARAAVSDLVALVIVEEPPPPSRNRPCRHPRWHVPRTGGRGPRLHGGR
ncbi:MAG: hypothetical protein U0531_09575 [Dehalococcoidia bacterium]